MTFTNDILSVFWEIGQTSNIEEGACQRQILGQKWRMQSQKNLASLKTLFDGKFCNPESFPSKRKNLIKFDFSLKFPDTQESFWTLWKVFVYPEKLLDFGKFLDTLQIFLDTKVSGNYGMFPKLLESFQTLWKVSGHFGKFLNILESFLTVCMFLDPLENVQTLWKVFANQSLLSGKCLCFLSLDGCFFGIYFDFYLEFQKKKSISYMKNQSGPKCIILQLHFLQLLVKCDCWIHISAIWRDVWI